MGEHDDLLSSEGLLRSQSAKTVQTVTRTARISKTSAADLGGSKTMDVSGA
jgi:hypothetical protein